MPAAAVLLEARAIKSLSVGARPIAPPLAPLRFSSDVDAFAEGLAASGGGGSHELPALSRRCGVPGAPLLMLLLFISQMSGVSRGVKTKQKSIGVSCRGEKLWFPPAKT
jgi:hypothetical protein